MQQENEDGRTTAASTVKDKIEGMFIAISLSFDSMPLTRSCQFQLGGKSNIYMSAFYSLGDSKENRLR